MAAKWIWLEWSSAGGGMETPEWVPSRLRGDPQALLWNLGLQRTEWENRVTPASTCTGKA